MENRTPPSTLLSNLLSEFLDDRQLAGILQVSPHLPAQWRYLGKFTDLPFYKFGRCVRYLRSDVEAWIEKCRVRGIATSEDA